MWPYRVVTRVFAALQAKYADRLSIETNTPVMAVEVSEGGYIVETPRGKIRAFKVLNCTNGYAGHLVPKLRGQLVAVRGTMTVQDLGPIIPNKGAEESFAFHYMPIHDEKMDTVADGLWYLTQNAKTGEILLLWRREGHLGRDVDIR